MNKSGYSNLCIKTVLLSVFLSSGYAISDVRAEAHTTTDIGDISAEVKKPMLHVKLKKSWKIKALMKNLVRSLPELIIDPIDNPIHR